LADSPPERHKVVQFARRFLESAARKWPKGGWEIAKQKKQSNVKQSKACCGKWLCTHFGN